MYVNLRNSAIFNLINGAISNKIRKSHFLSVSVQGQNPGTGQSQNSAHNLWGYGGNGGHVVMQLRTQTIE